MPQELIKQFFAYWWPTPIGSPERQRVKFAVKRGKFDEVDRLNLYKGLPSVAVHLMLPARSPPAD